MGTDPSRLVIKVKTSDLNRIDGVWINSLNLPHEVDLCIGENGVTLGGGTQRSFQLNNGGFFIPKAALECVSYQNDVLYLGESGKRAFFSKPKQVVVLIGNEADLEKSKAALPPTTDQPFGLNQNQIAQVAESFQLHKFLTQLKADHRSIYVTQAIIALNILAFIAIIRMGANPLDPSPDVLLDAGANFGPFTLAGQWWRLLTSLFLHFGLIHLLLNMNALYQIGQIMERLSGKSIFLLNYLGCGLMGSFASVYFNNRAISAGASGAIFGMFGSLFGYFLREKQGIPVDVVKKLRNSALVFALFNLFMGFTASGIDNAAHIGGLLTGVILGFLTALPLESNNRQKLFSRRFATAVVTISMLLAASFTLIPRREYKDFMQFNEFFVQHEKQAVEAYSNLLRSVASGQIDDLTFAGRLQDECLSHWVEMRNRGEKFKDLEDVHLSRIHKKFMDIADLWIESLNLMNTGLRTNNPALFKQGLEVSNKINAKIKETQ